MNNGDLARRNDHDGRGARWQEGLVACAQYFLDVCWDQSRFMGESLEIRRCQERIAALCGDCGSRQRLRFIVMTGGGSNWQTRARQHAVLRYSFRRVPSVTGFVCVAD